MKMFFSTAILVFFAFISNAQKIKQISTIPISPILDMRYIKNHLVVSQNGLLIYDVSKPKFPKLVSQASYPGNMAYDVAVQKNFVYLGAGSNGLFSVYDVSNFKAPVLKGSVAIPATAFYLIGEIQPNGSYAYVTGLDSLYVVNVSNPSVPKVTNQVAVPNVEFSGAQDITKEGHSLFIKTIDGIDIFDISAAASPVFIGILPTPHPVGGALASDTIKHRVFVPWATESFDGYDALDVSNPLAPKFLFSDSVPGIVAQTLTYSYATNVVLIGSFTSVQAFDASTQTHHFLDLFNGTDIGGRVIYIDAKDSLFFSAKEEGVEVLDLVPGNEPVCFTTSGLNAQNISANSAKITWLNIPGAEGYNVQVEKLGTSQKNTFFSNTNSKKITGLQPETTYQISVQTICDSNSKSSYSAPIFVTTAVTDRLTDADPMQLLIYPNPVTDLSTISITLQHSTYLSVDLYDVAGKLVSVIAEENVSEGNLSLTFNPKSLQVGTYFLRIKTSDSETTSKLIIQ